MDSSTQLGSQLAQDGGHDKASECPRGTVADDLPPWHSFPSRDDPSPQGQAWLERLFHNDVQYFQHCYMGRYPIHSIAAMDQPESPEAKELIEHTLAKIYDVPKLTADHKEFVVMDKDTRIRVAPRFKGDLVLPPIVCLEPHSGKVNLYLTAMIGPTRETFHLEVDKDHSSRQAIDESIRNELACIISQDWKWPSSLTSQTILLDDERVDAIASIVEATFEKRAAPDVRMLRHHVMLSKSLSPTPSKPCQWCDRTLSYDKLFAHVEDDLPAEIQLMTINGWTRCMQASRYFANPFSPSCPKLMRTLLFSTVWNSHAMNVDTACWLKVTPQRIVMTVFRILTYLRRDREVIQLAMQQHAALRAKYDVPFPVLWCGGMFEAPLDLSSWIVLLTWIVETCSPKSFFICMTLIPAKYTRIVASALESIFRDEENARLTHEGTIYTHFVLNEYLCAGTFSRSFELGVFREYNSFQVSERSIKWLARAIEAQPLAPPTGTMRHMRVLNAWMRLLFLAPEVRKVCLRRNFVKRAFYRMCNFFNFFDDTYLEDAFELINKTVEQSDCAQDSFVPHVVEMEVRNKGATLMQRVWGLMMKIKMTQEVHDQIKAEQSDSTVSKGYSGLRDSLIDLTLASTEFVGRASVLFHKVASFLLYPRAHGPALFAWTEELARRLHAIESSESEVSLVLREAYAVLDAINDLAETHQFVPVLNVPSSSDEDGCFQPNAPTRLLARARARQQKHERTRARACQELLPSVVTLVK